ncbi:6,7-dimethyl-8-ribityllumazine synthase [Candidatus Nomurabacteria bacterium]|nr:6,7-dimethyl-8-ribityllumazine synthase [Candidatus Nomurabacteria bacterium]
MLRKEFLKKIPTKDASALKVGIVLSEFNADITESMFEGAIKTLKEWKVEEENIEVYRVYGAFDLAYACDLMIKKYNPQAVIALGCIIKGDTDHDSYIASAVTRGIIDLTIKHSTPISLGILTTNNLEQAQVRSSGDTNHGDKAAVAALQAALL